MIIEVIAAFFVAYSFGILFNIKGKYLIIAGGGGAIGWFLYKFCMQIGIAETSSLFIASIGLVYIVRLVLVYIKHLLQY